MKRRERGSSMCQLQGPVKVRVRAWWGEAQSPRPDKPQGSQAQRLQFIMIFFKTSPDSLQAHSTSPQSTKSQSKAQPRGLGKRTADPLSSPHPANPPPHLTSLEEGSEGAGHLRVSENLETALS